METQTFVANDVVEAREIAQECWENGALDVSVKIVNNKQVEVTGYFEPQKPESVN